MISIPTEHGRFFERSRRLAACGIYIALLAGLCGAPACAPDEASRDGRDSRSADRTGDPPTDEGARWEVTTPATGYGTFDREEWERSRYERSWRPSDGDTTTAARGGPGGGAGGGADGGPGGGMDRGRLAAAADTADTAAVLRLQVLLDRYGFSPGVIDGEWGKNTAKAIYWLQRDAGLRATGLPEANVARLLEERAREGDPLASYEISPQDVEGPFAEIPDSVYQQAELECLCYGSPAEEIAERFHTSVEALARLNPRVDVERLAPGDILQVPAVEPMRVERIGGRDGAPATPDSVAPERADAGNGSGDETTADRLVISNGGFYTHLVSPEGRILRHYPSTLGSGYDPSPTDTLEIAGIAWRPTFHYQPELFHEVPDTEREAILPPGPNSPVGLVWMALSKPHFGIHGTAEPRTIGYATSHGCVRLSNWDAVELAARIGPGTVVQFAP